MRPARRLRSLVTVLSVFVVSPAGNACGAAAEVQSKWPSAAEIPQFDHVVVIVFGNKGLSDVLGSGAAPTFDRLARRYVSLTDYHGVAHPSLPNYLALVSGSTHGISSDCTDCSVSARNLVDTLEQAGKTWKTYAEGLPRPGFLSAVAGRYAKKHNPFLRSPSLRRGVVFVVFDEGRPSDSAGGGGHVPALVLRPLVRPGSRSSAPLDHYSLLRTIEQAWQLPLLGKSNTAQPISGIWRRQTGHTG